MKKILLLIILFLVPTTVLADGTITVTPRLECNETVKILGTTSCSIFADIEGGKIDSINANVCITPPGEATCESELFNGFNQNIGTTGNSLSIGTIAVTSEYTKEAGNINVSITFNSGISADGSVVFNKSLFNGQVKVLNNNATLSNLTIDSTSVFDKMATKLTYDKESIEIGAVTNDSKATVEGAGKTVLKCGEYTYNLTVTAEDKSTTKKYPLTIIRSCSKDATLKSIKLGSGSLVPTFSSAITEYSVNVSKDIEELSITPTPNSEAAKIKITKGTSKDLTLDFGKNNIAIEVTAEDGTVKIYTITVNREDGRSTNNYLSNLELSDGKILFNKQTSKYEVKVLYEVENITVTATPESETSKVEIIGGKNLVIGNNTISIKVVSENGAINEYTLYIKRLSENETLGDNPNIKTITIKGYDLRFNSNKNEYTLKIDKEKSLDIKVEMEDETSTYVIENNKNLKNKDVITIKTMSADGTTKTYKIVVEKSNLVFVLLMATFAISVSGGLIFIVLKNKNKEPKVKTKVVKDDKLLSKVDKQLGGKEEIKYTKSKELEEVEYKEEYKICSLCGHKLASNVMVCPYCKKNF